MIILISIISFASLLVGAVLGYYIALKKILTGENLEIMMDSYYHRNIMSYGKEFEAEGIDIDKMNSAILKVRRKRLGIRLIK